MQLISNIVDLGAVDVALVVSQCIDASAAGEINREDATIETLLTSSSNS